MVSTETPRGSACLGRARLQPARVDGARHSYESCHGDRGTVVMFICNHCPYVKSAIGRIVQDARALRDLGVRCVAISANDPAVYAEDSFEQMKRVAREQDFPSPTCTTRARRSRERTGPSARRTSSASTPRGCS
jgi:hypothetical protein